MKKQISVKLNIDTISDKLYLLILKEFKKEAESNGIDWDSIGEQTWELNCIIKQNKIK